MFKKIGEAIRKHKKLAIGVGAGVAGATAIALGVGLGVGLNTGSQAPAQTQTEVPVEEPQTDPETPVETTRRYNLRSDAQRSIAGPIPQENGYGPWIIQGETLVANRGDEPGDWTGQVGASASDVELATAPIGAVFSFTAKAESAVGKSAITRPFVITIIPPAETDYDLPDADVPRYGDKKFAAPPKARGGFELQKVELKEGTITPLEPDNLPELQGGTVLSGAYVYVQTGGTDTYTLKFLVAVAPRQITWTNFVDATPHELAANQSPDAVIDLPSQPASLDWANATWSFTTDDTGGANYASLADFNKATHPVFSLYKATIKVGAKNPQNEVLPNGASTAELSYRLKVLAPAGFETVGGYYIKNVPNTQVPALPDWLKARIQEETGLPGPWTLTGGEYRGGMSNARGGAWNHELGGRLTAAEISGAPSGTVIAAHLWTTTGKNVRVDRVFEATVVDEERNLDYGVAPGSTFVRDVKWQVDDVTSGNMGRILAEPTGNNRLEKYAKGKTADLDQKDIPAGTVLYARYGNANGDYISQIINIKQIVYNAPRNAPSGAPYSLDLRLGSSFTAAVNNALLSTVVGSAFPGADKMVMKVQTTGLYEIEVREEGSRKVFRSLAPDVVGTKYAELYKKYKDRNEGGATDAITMVTLDGFKGTLVPINDNYVINGDTKVSFH